jgi:hypothetical protein
MVIIIMVRTHYSGTHHPWGIANGDALSHYLGEGRGFFSIHPTPFAME